MNLVAGLNSLNLQLTPLLLGKVYHVAKTGNDGSSGSQAYPFLTISRAAGVVNPGDVIIVHEGSYNEVVELNRSGTAASWINLRAAPGEHVVIDGSGLSLVYPATSHFWVNGASYIALEDFETINSPQAGIGCHDECHFLTFRGLYLHECGISGILLFWDWGTTNLELCTDILIDGCITEKTNIALNQEGISLIGVNRFEVKYCTMLTQYHQAGLDCKESTSNGHIHHNLFNQHNTNGIYLDAGYGNFPTSNIEIDHNTFKHNSDGIDLQAEDGGQTNYAQHYLKNINIHDNLIYDMFTDPIPPAAIGSYWGGMTIRHAANAAHGSPPHQNIQIHDNIIVAYQAYYSSGIAAIAPKSAYQNCGIKNNTFINFAGYERFITHQYNDFPGPGLVIDSNRYYTPGGTYIESDTPDGSPDGGNMFGTNRQVGLAAVLDDSKGIVLSGTTKTFVMPVTIPTANQSCTIEVDLNVDNALKAFGKVNFVSTGGLQNITVPVVMPGYGVYDTFVKLTVAGNVTEYGSDPIVVVQ